jgi:hypothetical protein
MIQGIEPAVIRHIADAMACLQQASDETAYGLVEDHIANAIEELIKAIKCSMSGGV